MLRESIWVIHWWDIRLSWTLMDVNCREFILTSKIWVPYWKWVCWLSIWIANFPRFCFLLLFFHLNSSHTPLPTGYQNFPNHRWAWSFSAEAWREHCGSNGRWNWQNRDEVEGEWTWNNFTFIYAAIWRWFFLTLQQKKFPQIRHCDLEIL